MSTRKRSKKVAHAADYEHIGAYLRDLREHYRLKIEDVSQRLHIRAKYIVALEEGNMDELPGKVYTLGYLQSYAEFLGLNPTEIVQQYHQLKQLDNKQSFKIVEPDQQQGRPAMHIVVASVVVLLVGFLLWRFFASGPDQPTRLQPTVDAVPEQMLKQADNALMMTSRNRKCLRVDPQPIFPPCYTLDAYIPPTAFTLKPVTHVMELY